ncbi:MAG TPA: heme o synthase [Thermoanaerobaculia bacterium]|nr:heme o synthase [Thermoanaerobaculia bacterium]
MKAEAVSIAAGQVRWGDLLELAKPRITLMVLVTVAAGAFLAAPEAFSAGLLLETLLATGLLASAASALNQVIESREDARMSRTRHRPVAAGRLDRGWVAAGAAASSVLAIAVLAWRANLLAAAIGGLTVVSYLFLYTPLKKRTAWATVVGAVPGALPPMLGWAAAAGEIGTGAWVLFGIVFLWQLPHFMAIAWMYRDDYERGGFAVLPIRDRNGLGTALAMVVPVLALVTLTTLAPSWGVGSIATAAGGLVAGLGFLGACLMFWRRRQVGAARTVLLASIFYLPAVLAAVLVDHLPPGVLG